MEGQIVKQELVEEGQVDQKVRGYCNNCQFEVNLIGHEARCGKTKRTPETIKVLAEIGGKRFDYDVAVQYIARVGIGVKMSKLSDKTFKLDMYSSNTVNNVFPTIELPNPTDKQKMLLISATYAVSQDFRTFVHKKLFYDSPILTESNTTQLLQTFMETCNMVPTPFIDGFCYLWFFPGERWSHAREKLGMFPTIRAIKQYARFFVLENTFHCSMRESRVHVSINASFPSISPADLVDTWPDHWRVGSYAAISEIASVQNLPVIARETALNQFLLQSFEECNCRIHRKPVTALSSEYDQGCYAISHGKAVVMKNAYYEQPSGCSVDASVRNNDKKLLATVLSLSDLSGLDMTPATSRMRKLCNSSTDTSFQIFGSGYCYLQVINDQARWRVARILGPNPKVADVFLFFASLARKRLRSFEVRKIGDKGFHFRELSEVVRTQKQNLYDLCIHFDAILSTIPDAFIA